MHGGDEDDCEDIDGQGQLDNGDPKNPPNKTPGALHPITQLPTSKDLGGDGT